MSLDLPIITEDTDPIQWLVQVRSLLTQWADDVDRTLQQLPSDTNRVLWDGKGLRVPTWGTGSAGSLSGTDGRIVAFTSDPAGGTRGPGWYRWDAASSSWVKY